MGLSSAKRRQVRSDATRQIWRSALRLGYPRKCLGDVVHNAIECILKRRSESRANRQGIANLDCAYSYALRHREAKLGAKGEHFGNAQKMRGNSGQRPEFCGVDLVHEPHRDFTCLHCVHDQQSVETDN